MKTVKLTDEELAIIKTVLTMQIKDIDREIRFAQAGGKNIESLIEIQQQYKNVFEILNYAE
ncbi:hypothetical protein [Saccharococcus thermophilus]|uniref:Uncharacterized protein n=1 Tax=Saccharococcus thermophilus TaxID=29396 RepID=A0A846MJE2_9BACL|nr:hypothetical protein [Saccharococcus thermophilus]NIK15745.1 hypothetical protein [Saccharococcus thermophilus]